MKISRVPSGAKFAATASKAPPNLEDDLGDFFDIIHEFIVDDAWGCTATELEGAITDEFPDHEVEAEIDGANCFVSISGPVIRVSITTRSDTDEIEYETHDDD